MLPSVCAVLVFTFLPLVTVAIPGCTRLGRQCSSQALCVNKKCVCPGQGSGILCCADEDQHLCEVYGDPRIKAYEKATGKLHWPCRYRLTRFVTPLEGGTPGWSSCSFEVFGINWVSASGKYFARAVEVALAIGDSANQVFSQDDIAKFDLDSLGIASSSGASLDWGSSAHASWNGVDVTCEFDMSEGFAVLSIPRCGIRIKFRPHNPADDPGAQINVPGIAIIADQGSVFGLLPQGRFPESLCGMPAANGDNETLYEDRADVLGLDNRNQVLLYEALGHQLDQNGLLPAENLVDDVWQCENSIDIFNNICADDVAKRCGIRGCHKILKRKKTVKCLGPANVLQCFNLCLRALCTCGAADISALTVFFSNSGCSIPKRVMSTLASCC